MSGRGCCDDGCECACSNPCASWCEDSEWLQRLQHLRNPISSVVAGILFAVGWWFMIDGTVNGHIKDVHQLCGVGSTIGLFMINAVSATQMDADNYTEGKCGPTGVRLWLFLGLMISFGSMIGAIWLFAEKYSSKETGSGQDLTYSGAALFLQNALIFIGSLIFKFGRNDADW
eukprot:m.15365 g.15365  ORF g.15365 m.15365 type:complete len:173 (+) comp7370_c0_seq1:75-593(+)